MPMITRRELLLSALSLLPAARWARAALAAGDGPGNFRRVYDDPVLRDRFFWFLQNVFRLYPEDRFHQLIIDLTAELRGDRLIYEELRRRLPGLRSPLSPLTYALPALRKQKEEMTRQALEFIGEGKVDGYVEIGAPARYVSSLRKRLRFSGPMWIVNDYAPSYAPADLLERGGLAKLGTYLPLGDYEPIAVPEGSVELVTNFIGFHHCPPARLDGFIGSIRRALKPGGRLLLRDHDAGTEPKDALVALAHDVFNAGVGLSWPENHAQLRHFRSMKAWTQELRKAGFKRREKLLAQDHDPTDNLLAEFVRA